MSCSVPKENKHTLNPLNHLRKLTIVFIGLTIYSWGIGLLRVSQTDILGKLLGLKGIEAFGAALLFLFVLAPKTQQPHVHLGVSTSYFVNFAGIFLIQLSLYMSLIVGLLIVTHYQ